MSVATKVTLEEFLALPDPQGNFFDTHELHEGEIVEVPGPSGEHVNIQKRLERLLEARVPTEYTVWREFYYTLPEQSRRADVAVVREARREEQRHTVFFGAPEIVIEVLSESNGAAELAHLRRECLAEQCEQFWIVDPFDRVVEVFRRDGSWYEYPSHTTLPFHFAGCDLELPVAALFA